MSLKAKIEAVIYAAEEPVTLAQLMGLLGQQAQAELDARQSSQQSLALEDEGSPEQSALPVEDADALNREILQPEEVLPPQTSAEPPAEGEAGSIAAAAEPAVDEKKLQRERERRLREYFRSLLDALIADYAEGDRGLEIREVAGGFRLATKPEFHDAVRGFVKSLKPPLKLSLAALETLAVVAYKQPVTAPEVSEIRGVDSAGTLGSLITRKLITTAGRKPVIGRPMLYRTTKDFLLRFGLKDIAELPSIEEFEKMAGELNGELGGTQEEMAMGERPDDGQRSDDSAEALPVGGDGSAPVAELEAVPEPTHLLHETPEDLMADDSTAPEGQAQEHADPAEAEPHSAAAMAAVHSAQADGTPDE